MGNVYKDVPHGQSHMLAIMGQYGTLIIKILKYIHFSYFQVLAIKNKLKIKHPWAGFSVDLFSTPLGK